MTEKLPHSKEASRSEGGPVLKSHNVYVNQKRTSVRLEDEMWEALQVVAKQRGVSIHSICSEVSSIQENYSSFSSALRVYLLRYFRNISESQVSAA